MNVVLPLSVVGFLHVTFAQKARGESKETFENSNVSSLPLIISTWASDQFQQANGAAWNKLMETGNRLEAVVAGCSTCETLQCDFTVGYGGSPDDKGETTLDALLMDGPGHRMGAVGDLRRVKEASRVAWAVMNFTKHSFLVGESATEFALEMGFQESNLSTNVSNQMAEKWRLNKCQPNFRKNVLPDPRYSCGPYRPACDLAPFIERLDRIHGRRNERSWASEENHDTIGMVVVDSNGDVSVGTSTNGATHKIHGRVGDSPIPGAGAYVDNDVGGASATGDGDVMMRFLPSYQAVESMRMGMEPSEAAEKAIRRILRYYPSFSGAVIAGDKKGSHGAACNNVEGGFKYCVSNKEGKGVRVVTVRCI